MLHSPVDTTLQIIYVIGILAHSLSFAVGDLRNILTVTLGGLHNDVKSGNFGIICNISSDTECNLCSSVKVSIDVMSLFEIK